MVVVALGAVDVRNQNVLRTDLAGALVVRGQFPVRWLHRSAMVTPRRIKHNHGMLVLQQHRR